MAFDLKKKVKSVLNPEKAKEEELISLIKTKYNLAYSAKGTLHEDWRRFEKAYDGDLFKRNAPEYRADEVSNFVFSTIETMKPIMLSNYPKLNVVPKSPDSFYKSQLVQNALDYEWKREKMFSKLVEASHNALTYGTTIFGLFWNGKTNSGLGDINCKVISPFNFFPDPNATSMDDADYVIYATYKGVGELCDAYPEKAEELKKNTTSSPDSNLLNNAGSFSGNNNVLYIECYFRDYSVDTEVEDELDEEKNPTGNKVETKKRKYPKGRRTIIGGDVLLYDGENPYPTGDFPFKAWRCYPIPNKFFGIGEVKNIVSPQKYRIDIMNSIIENAGMMGNPVWILDKNAGVEKNSLTNRRGLVVRKNPGTEVRREPPPAIPAYIKDIVNTLDSDIEKISGVYDVLRGDRPTGVTAASAITALNEQAQGRIKLKVQLMEEITADIGGLWLRYMQEFWETTRTIRVMGGNYEADELTNVSLEQEQQALMEQSMQMSQEQMPQAQTFNLNGKKVSFQDVTKDDLDGDFDVEITAGSTMQQNKSARLQQLISLAQTPAEDGMPMIDRKTLLENSGVDNVMDVVRRFDTMAQKQQESQLQAQEQQAQASQANQQMKMQETQMKEQMKSESDMQKLQVQHEQDLEKKQVDKQLESQGKLEDVMLAPKEESTEGKSTESKSTKTKEEPQMEQPQEEVNPEAQAMLEQIIQALSQMSPEEVQELAQREPKVAQLLQMISSMQ